MRASEHAVGHSSVTDLHVSKTWGLLVLITTMSGELHFIWGASIPMNSDQYCKAYGLD